MKQKIQAINELYKDIKEPLWPYGADYVIKKFTGCNNVTRYRVNWAHGWIPDWHTYAPNFVVGQEHTFLSRKSFVYFVAKKIHKEILESYGYSNVYCVGVPYVYTDFVDLEREDDSCLFVPCHSTWFDNAFHFQDKIVDTLKFLKKKYKHVYTLFHPVDLALGNYNKIIEFSDFIIGAHWQDSNALPRIKSIFNLFNNLVTNGLGSHVFYSGILKVNVQILENLYFIPGKDENMLKGRETIYEMIKQDWSLKVIKSRYNSLFEREPQEIAQLSEYELGMDNKVNGYYFIKYLKSGFFPAIARHVCKMKI